PARGPPPAPPPPARRYAQRRYRRRTPAPPRPTWRRRHRGASAASSARAARAALAAARLAHRLGMRARLGLLRLAGRRGRGVGGQIVPRRRVEAEPGEAFREMVRQLGGDVDLAPIGVIDADAPCVEVHLAADPAGQERGLPAIFAVAKDRVAD